MTKINKDITKVIFFESNHTYWYGDRKVPSVGSVFKKYFPEFDKDYWLTHNALKLAFGKEYENHYSSIKGIKPDRAELFGPFMKLLTPAELRKLKKEESDRWGIKSEISLFKGSKFHKEREDEDYEKGYSINPFNGKEYEVITFDKFYDNESYGLDLSQLPNGAYPEALLFNKDKITLAGQTDKIFIDSYKGKKYVDINDYKTGEKKPSKSSPERCYSPIDSLYASNHNKYVVQINLYMHLLSTHGLIPRDKAYTFYEEYDVNKSEIIEVPNIQKSVKEMLKFC